MNNWDSWENEPAQSDPQESHTSHIIVDENIDVWKQANSQANIQVVRSTAQNTPRTEYSPELRILKRPSTNSGTSSSSSLHSSLSTTPTGTSTSRADRERAYNEARRKIFGDDNLNEKVSGPRRNNSVNSTASNKSKKENDSSRILRNGQSPVQPLRQPRGPDSNAQIAKGFRPANP